MEDWKESQLSEVAEIIMGQSPKGESCNSDGEGYPLLNGPTEFGISHPFPIQFSTDGRKFSQPLDILFCVRGSTTGRMNWSDRQYAIGRGIAAIRHKKGSQYRYFIKGIIDYNLPLLLSSATGSTFPNVSRTQLEELELLLPPLSEQQGIAETLSSLDDKINLLHLQNFKLEELAEILYRQWFILDANTESDEVFLSDVANHHKKNIKPFENPFQEYFHYSIPAFDDGQNPQIELGNTILSNKYQVMTSSILISKLNPRFPRVWQISKPIDEEVSICSTEFQVVVPHEQRWFPFIYYFLKSRPVTDELIGAAGGTSGSHQRVSPDDIFNLSFIKPDDARLNQFHQIVSPNLEKINNNREQILKLEKLRNTLLPKLMSGEVRVKM